MKTRSFILAAVAAIAAVGCSHKVSEKTTITGDLGVGVAKEVQITIREARLDTIVPVSGGRFTAEIPAVLTGLAKIQADNIIGNFISDGTPLTITLKDDKTFDVVSKYPEISVNAKYTAFQDKMKELQKTYQPKIEAAENEEAEDKLYDAYQADVKNLCLAAVAENNDNVIAASAIENLQYLLNNNQLDSVVSTLGPAASKIATIQNISSVVKSRKATEEGQKFSDFEVGGVKLSDYVGKGKYILVDFWASWCGPCKAEVPNLKNVYQKYAGKDFDILGVAVWDKPEASQKAVKDLGMTWNQILNAQSVPTDIYGIQGIPHIILFGPDGTIVKRDLRGEDIEAEVAKVVKPVK